MPYTELRKGRVSLFRHAYVVTTVTAARRPLFTDLALGRIAVSALRAQDESGASLTLAFVIMPDHVHWLLQLCGTVTLSNVVRNFKGRSARMINQHLHHTGSIWQPAFHDHGIRTAESLRDHARYIVMNPVRAGLVEHVRDYPLWDCVWL